ncbi:Lrp/AsnC family transcriptional regulator [Thermomonas aquatica]|uniref:Lrp/AsnC family transcriptional regulator n=1 Tax=Thermomonas aquatica TaxID=2202149 RepID=A0A5B7ZQN7_9GAMM|nr:Lrp/AsnC family transcriptional regulator [Thermomonas aquatica]QDA57147.1 Lrp/AsnC family transcriptional regulator [Thermomonas aquatica]
MAIPILLDDFDHRLLALLQDDAARTLTALGEAVGLSPSAVQRRITRYRKHGLLQQVAVLDSTAFPAVVLAAVWVTMERESVRTLNAFYARMRAAPEVQQCYQLAGDWDYLVIMATTSVGAYREAAERLFKVDGNIKRYETRLVFDTVKRGLRLPTQAPSARSRRRG